MKKLIILFLVLPVWCLAQDSTMVPKRKRAKETGEVSLGMRSTISLFDHNGFPGLGYGGMFRIRPSKRINTEWYCDYIKTDIASFGYRETIHIGWSVMIYPFKTETKKGKFTPYLIGGNCFDYAKISTNLFFEPGQKIPLYESSTRVTTAVQAGFGVNYHFSDKFNLSFSGQYMEHIGKEIHADVVDKDNIEITDRARYKDSGAHLHIVHTTTQEDLILSGHLLITLSLNVVLFDIAK